MDWGKLLGDITAVTALLDRLLQHGHVLNCGPRSWRLKKGDNLNTEQQIGGVAALFFSEARAVKSFTGSVSPYSANESTYPETFSPNTVALWCE